ncbi:DUF3575 domain-containing protein [Mangrovivirga sp. M17]|uniref:DUF3575 domain-containing protein n=1 Tax=Mangrovivirga halotolerans TaxID=2993936 RepID=A0ABT3RUQ2_9BACT|nr:DUF3575 domain-containing protein [Mangrovivirga halotolerans]MCX2745508.1 DUF3575 domain-containing protein [Mangrovivirga halotolerans]
MHGGLSLFKWGIIFLTYFLSFAEVHSQNEDSVGTPFIKGKWISGLSGTISSGTAISDTTTQRAFNNNYGMNLSTGKFIANRWMLGLIFNSSRQNSNDIIKRNLEQLFIGPLVSYYFSDNETGSLFVSLSPGYTSFQDEISLVRNGLVQGEKVKGDGFGLYFRFGYTYVIHHRILLEFGLNVSNSWVGAERLSFPANSRTYNNLQIGTLSFSFGFNVLLDDFFF